MRAHFTFIFSGDNEANFIFLLSLACPLSERYILRRIRWVFLINKLKTLPILMMSVEKMKHLVT